MNTRHIHTPRGFSLLEVLIAVAILSFGLLAITSLQASLVRNSAEAKARSVGLSLAKDKIEELRAYRTMDDYLAMTDDTNDPAVIIGGTTYTVTTTVQRYGYNNDPNDDGDTADATFQAIASDTAEDPAGNFVSENEFKRISVSVGWTDSAGQAQNVVIEDAIGSVAPENTGKLARRNPDAADRKPQILITNPSNEAGVIPIAIGDGSETAATNPRPEIISGNTIGTSFDIFTFAALNNSANALAQSRVENFIIGCTCDKTEADSNAVDYRPTYWDGQRYVAPEEAIGYPVQAGVARHAPPQSVLCTSCCRDHHDPTGASAPLFSPRLDAPHQHYAQGNLTTPSSGQYIEACRVIRVDGIFRVASDPYNEYTNILRTAVKSGETDFFTETFPDDTASDRYVDFVIDYLETQGGQSNPNTQINQANADQMANTAGLNEPTQTLEIGEVRWTHARGLYIDYLEPDAIDAISESQADCPEPLTESQCLLRVLPFTSINVTELATWTAGSSAFTVDNNLFSTSLSNPNPVRGRVVGYNTGTADAKATIRTSTTGLLANDTIVINPYDRLVSPTLSSKNIGDQPDSDEQSFQVVGPTPPACGLLMTASPSAIPRNGGVYGFQTSGSCSGSDGSKPLAATSVKLTISTTSTAPNPTRIELVAPDGTVYQVRGSGTTWSQVAGVYILSAAGTPTQGGTWTLRVYNDDNQTAVANVAFSVEFLYTASFTMQLANYTFQPNGQTLPSFAMVPTGSCEFKIPLVNPTNCTTTQPGVSTIMTMSKYNYSYIDNTPRTVQCMKNADVHSCSVTSATMCKNFSAVSASVDGGAPILPGTVSNDGKTTESTPFTFSSISQGSSIVVTMSEGAPTVAPCTVNNSNCNGLSFSLCP